LSLSWRIGEYRGPCRFEVFANTEHHSLKYITMSHRTKALLKIIIVGDSK
jgi:hypothetical protein